MRYNKNRTVPRWRNWHTRQVEGLCPLGVEVRVLSGAPRKTSAARKSGAFALARTSPYQYLLRHLVSVDQLLEQKRDEILRLAARRVQRAGLWLCRPWSSRFG